jgi:DNA mismatch endonuclease (patch repair protein)
VKKKPNDGVARTCSLTRSELMSKVRGKHSSAERALRSALHARGLRFRLHRRIETISIDIVFPGAQVAVFVDGCFWHGCPEHATFPKTNQSYWLPKLAENKERDCRQSARLRAAGWTVFRVWEHECLPPARGTVEQIVKACRGEFRTVCVDGTR